MIVQHDEGTGVTVTNTYTSYDQVDSVLVNNVMTLKQFFSGSAKMPDSVRTDSANVTRFTYDVAGRLLTATDLKGSTTTLAYDPSAFGNTTSIVRSGSGITTETTTIEYDAAGRVWRVTDPTSRQFTTLYDKLDRVKQENGPSSTVSTYTYDDVNGTYTVTDPKGQVYRQKVNARGWTVAQADPRQTLSSPNVDSLFYDRRGRVTRQRDRRLSTIALQYDGLDRITRRIATLNGGTPDTTHYAFDPNHRWLAARNAESTDTIFADNGGRLSTAKTIRAGKTYRSTYGYNAQSLVSNITVLRDSLGYTKWSDTVGYNYNAAMNQSGVVDFGNKGTTIFRGKSEQIDTIVLPTHVTYASRARRAISYYNSSTVQTDYYTGAASSPLIRYYSDRDKLGRITDYSRWQDGQLVPRYHTYDALGRVTQFQTVRDTAWTEINWIPWDPYNDCPGCMIEDTTYHYGYDIQTTNYTYDAVGNRTDHLTGHGSQVATGNRITNANGYAITYDSSGNITSRSQSGDTHTYTWNALGQLVQVSNNSGMTTYGYDGWGRRVRKTVNGTVTRYLLDGDHVLVEVDGNHSATALYSYYQGTDQLHSMKRGGTTYYYAQDQQGNIAGLLSQSGALSADYDYTPYGVGMASSSSVTNPYQFKGRELDAEAGLYFMRARYYEPQLGRFLSEDPIGLAGGINPTAFVGGDPVNLWDPTGLGPDDPYNPGTVTITAKRPVTWLPSMQRPGFRQTLNEGIFSGDKYAPPENWFRLPGRLWDDTGTWFAQPCVRASLMLGGNAAIDLTSLVGGGGVALKALSKAGTKTLSSSSKILAQAMGGQYSTDRAKRAAIAIGVEGQNDAIVGLQRVFGPQAPTAGVDPTIGGGIADFLSSLIPGVGTYNAFKSWQELGCAG